MASLPPDPDGDASWLRPPERLETAPQLANAPLRSPTISQFGDRDTPHLRRLQQYCASEVVHSVAWVADSSHELLASAGNKVMRLYDLRAPAREGAGLGGGAAIHWQTRAVHYITPDPDRPKRLASVETTPQGGIVRLWDTRRPNSELCALEVVDGSGVVSLEWATGAPGGGALGVGTREGGVSIWDIATGGKRSDGTDDWTTIGGMRNSEWHQGGLLTQSSNPSSKCSRLHSPRQSQRPGGKWYSSSRTGLLALASSRRRHWWVVVRAGLTPDCVQ